MTSGQYVFAMDEQARQHAEVYLGETEERRKECLEHMAQWLDEHPELNARTDPLSVLAFLRGCKFDLNKTKKKLTNYYKLRAKSPEWFSQRDPTLPAVREMLQLGVFLPLTKSHNGQLVVVIKTAAHNSKKPVADLFKTAMIVLDIALRKAETATVYGVHAIIDLKGMSLMHALQYTPGVIERAVHAWQNYHCRPQRIDFINTPYGRAATKMLNFFKMFMTKKLQSRVFVHDSHAGIVEVLPKDVLPQEYDGCGESLDQLVDIWHQEVLDHKEILIDDEKYKADLRAKST